MRRLNELGLAASEMRRLRDETIRGVGALDKERLQLWDLERYSTHTHSTLSCSISTNSM